MVPDNSPWRLVLRRFQQADLWMFLALITLAGWTLDALVMFLRMHTSYPAGLIEFARHFWYAAPVTMAVIVLSRLRRKADLLGVAVYDEAGHLVRQEGACGLEELAAAESLAAMRAGVRQGLHGLSLRSGAQAYFVRQGAYTLLLNYSAAANSADLERGIQRLRADLPPTTFDLFADLGPRTAALAASVLCSPVKRQVLTLFYRFSRTAMQISDVQYRLGYSEDEVEAAIVDLETLGLLERFCACDLVFHRLRRDEDVMTALRALFEWQETWRIHITRLSDMIGEPVSTAVSLAPDNGAVLPGEDRQGGISLFDPHLTSAVSKVVRSQAASQTDPVVAAVDRPEPHHQ